jgi:23S rRNA (guanosine2251-2'-O)-methyltransferase
VVVGRRPALEAVRAGVAQEILVAGDVRSTPGLREVAEAAGRAGIPVRTEPSETIERLAGETRHQGVVARVHAPFELSEADVRSRPWSPDAVVVVLDGVTDPGNVGAVARTAEAAGAEALILRRRRGAGMSAAAVKASAGALLHLPVASVPNLARALATLKDAGFWVVGLDEAAPAPLGEAARPEGHVALVLGSEGEGLSRLVRSSCDELLHIPMRGRVGSLNVSVAAGVALFAYALPGKGVEGTPSASEQETTDRFEA